MVLRCLRAEHDPAILHANRARLDHTGVVNDTVNERARSDGRHRHNAAIRIERAAVLDQTLERLAGRNIDDLRGDLVIERKLDEVVAVRSSVKAFAEARATLPRRAVITPSLRTAGATSAAMPASVTVIVP